MAGPRGIDSRFFASAPTQAMDPNAGIPDQANLRHLTDVVMQTDRDRLAAGQFEKNMAFRNREFDAREERADTDDMRAAGYLDLQKQELARRQGATQREQVSVEQQAVTDAARRWYAAKRIGDKDGMRQAISEMKALGVNVTEYGQHAQQGAATPASPAAPPRQPHPMNASDAALSKQLTTIENTMVPQLTGRPMAPAAPAHSPQAPGSASDQALAAQMAAIEADMVPKLRGPGFLPGQRPVRSRTAQSDAMLSPGDPLNNIK